MSDIPELAREWDASKNKENPEKITSGSNKKVWWKCAEGHEWQAVIYDRAKGRKCPYCTNKRVLIGFNDLRTLFPEIAEEWNESENIGSDMDELVPGSNKKVSWKCSTCGFVWIASIASRTKNKTGCPQCAIKRRTAERNKTILKSNGHLSDPVLLESWDYEKNYPMRPQDVTANSNKKVWWKCPKCGHSWNAKINNRAHGRGCPGCSNRVLIKGKNDLKTCNPELAVQWHPTKNYPTTPEDIFPKSGKKYWWVCPKGHEYQASALHRSAGTNCPVCNSGRQTSYAEQAVFYYVKNVFPDAQNRYKDIFKNGMELDIFIPSIRLAIEYDGVFWHKMANTERDREKYRIC